MNKSMLFISLLSTAIVIISCKKDNSQAVNQPNSISTIPTQEKGIPPFSGIWTGTVNVDDINPGLCNYTGDPITTKQAWVVSPDSSITISDTLFDFNSARPWPRTWKGRLYNQDSLFITMTTNVRCFGADQPVTTQLRAKIVRTPNNKYTVIAKVDYPMCPPDCLFVFNYLVEKQE